MALRLFAQRGFTNVSVADLAAEVGITTAGLLHHFGTKNALLIAVLQERESRNQDADQALRGAGRNWLETYLERLEQNEEQPALVQLFALLSAESIAQEHPAHDWFVERYRSAAQEAADELSTLIDPSKLPDGITVATVGQWLIGLADGLRLQQLLNPGSVNRHESVRMFVSLLEPYRR
ncbi:TetR/AcrR family transcriptional regulator [Curtobacterium sp. VKM Ac-1376]|uniref:TetR/AcrR family transcriptional regulator n=1 Tax=Curtobacterium sp. VKM Ac-1376 TaxID=123312 RepID=UPI00188A592E|nr:TetR/AcrR family transcriptional regulator [Curtobacterium sp. VKM Ac-1376]MBF4614171.1 helix-turn-helix transcriptional regulator [Curtobacterium sp. VKM Ac-1376]